ncbi:hypothetical protein TRFO_09690 [Tritrichomonas foetus]|uniref:Uncharacterized protein n=1 Tax=Tritrichomonas foetus TaxID=1144522 RepID=A0A1J4JIS7_9EUKA|nr:hypothetical protein TRFO_09690 [Tritrichomonas foetus]|eukprot:OHS97116.1 hypothetical protein TRFO_09690 [Tritrichomonas foetus]
MLWLILLFSSAWMGFEVLPLIKFDCPYLSFRILCGWLVGSLLSGYFTFILNFLLPVNWIISLFCILVNTSAAHHLRKKRPKTPIRLFHFTISSWLLFYLTFIAGVSLMYLSQLYKTIPESVPFIFQTIFEEEISFISYVMKSRRSNVLFYEETCLSNFYYKGYSIPLLYVSSLMSLGANYSDASIIICFFNIFSIAFLLYKTTKKFVIWNIVPCFYFFFSGPSAARLFFNTHNRNDPHNDLIHQIDSKHSTISYQMIFSILSFSKASSFTVPLTQFAYSFKNVYLALLIPNIPASIGVLVSLLVKSKSNIKKVWPVCLILLIRLFPFNFSFYPLFREEAMRGSILAAFKIWFDVFSITLPSIIFIGNVNTKCFDYVISTLSGFCILIFMREGYDRFINFTAMMSLFAPALYSLFSALLKTKVNSQTNKQIKGCFLYIHWAIFFTFVIGGFICGYRIITSKESFIGLNEKEMIKFISKNIPKTEVLFTKSKLLIPAILSGRKLFLGDRKTLYLQGYKITQRNLDYKEIINSNFSKSLLQKHLIKYIIDENNEFSSLANYIPIFSNLKYKIYRID